jgi:hypothetical protein
MPELSEIASRGTGLNRRTFLRSAGAGAAGAAVMAAGGVSLPAAALAQTHDEPEHDGSRTHFGRMFPELEPFARASPALQAALIDIGRAGGILDAADDLSKGPILLITDPTLSQNNPNNPTHTAGTTFVGQFVDHDLTFDTTSHLGVPTVPGDAPNARTPAFDLDSVYGRGPAVDPQLYAYTDRAKLKVESGGTFEDVPRTAEQTAIIGDPRNDDHLVIAGLHAAFSQVP